MAHITRTPRLIAGSFLITIGALLMLNQVTQLPFDFSPWSLWPWLLVALGLLRFKESDWIGGLMAAGFGGVFLAAQYIPEFEIRDVFEHWPLILVGIGLVLVVRGIFGDAKPRKKRLSTQDGSDRMAFFRNLDLKSTAEDYRGTGFLAFIGHVKLDLTGAELAPEGATIEVFAMWGALEVRVPSHWSVELRVAPFMGGAEDKTKAPGPIEGFEPRLVITGFAWMAGVEVLN